MWGVSVLRGGLGACAAARPPEPRTHPCALLLEPPKIRRAPFNSLLALSVVTKPVVTMSPHSLSTSACTVSRIVSATLSGMAVMLASTLMYSQFSVTHDIVVAARGARRHCGTARPHCSTTRYTYQAVRPPSGPCIRRTLHRCP